MNSRVDPDVICGPLSDENSTSAGAPAAEPAPLATFVRESYTKYEQLVPMRDGTRLFTAVYVPKDAGPAKRYPILMLRTPYSVAPYGSDAYPETLGPSEAAAREKFIPGCRRASTPRAGASSRTRRRSETRASPAGSAIGPRLAPAASRRTRST